MVLNDSNYYSSEADMEYMSATQYKDFAGTSGKAGCEHAAMEKLAGRWEEEAGTAVMVGSYVDRYVEGTLDSFKAGHPEMFKRDGELKAEYKQADKVIERMKKDRLFWETLGGQKQVIMTGEMFGSKWKIKMDSYIPHKAIVDLKVVKAVRGKDAFTWVRDYGYMYFVLYWGYDIQGAIYQEIVYQNTGERLPFIISAATKQEEPDLRVIRVDQAYLNAALAMVEKNMPRILRVKAGELKPDMCGACGCCRRDRVIEASEPLSGILDEI